MLALGEMVPPEEVAALIVFLASGTSRHLTGATIDLNGATYIR
jgi:NAD(P)-dependent dehydrogenase (short-subunit alcohol dehydrogenase family)